MNPLILRLCCGRAAIGGEPGCACDSPDEIVVGRLVRSERREWWNRRMRQRTRAERRDLEGAIGNRRRTFPVLMRHAARHRRRFVHSTMPLWWQWTRYLTAAMVGLQMTLEIERRGGLCRDRG